MSNVLDKAKVLETDLRIAMQNAARQAKQATHDQLRNEALINSLDEATILADKDSKLIFINRKAISIFEIQHVNYRDISLTDLFKIIISNCQITDVEKLNEVIAEVDKPESLLTETFTLEIVKPINLFLKVYTGPIYDDNAGFLGRIWKFEDQTASILLDKIKSEFISIASHQLRTPLTSIIGYLDMVMAGDFGTVPDELKEALQASYTASLRMRNLINDLLNTSRIEAHKTVPKYVDCSLADLVAAEIEAEKITAQTKNLHIEFTKPEFNDHLTTDSALLQECVKNYLSNAIKYTPADGTIIITISTVDKDLKLEIKDSGLGIPAAAQSHIFEKMFRADNVMTENFEGTGLGLYYVKQVITALGGEVGFESSEGKGSTFWFTMPRKTN